jgi:hypothetical protein
VAGLGVNSSTIRPCSRDTTYNLLNSKSSRELTSWVKSLRLATFCLFLILFAKLRIWNDHKSSTMMPAH